MTSDKSPNRDREAHDAPPPKPPGIRITYHGGSFPEKKEKRKGFIGLRKISFVTPHPAYMALGKGSASTAASAYLELFKGHIAEDDMTRIHESWVTGTPLGNDYFKHLIEAQLQCKVGQARRGRPLKGL